MYTAHNKLIFAGIFALAAAAVSAQAAAAQDGWRTYRSPDFGFRIGYPRTLSFYPGGPLPPREQHSMIPICDETTIACFIYNRQAFDHTVIQALGVAVNVLRDETSEADCDDIDGRPEKTIFLNGRTFHFADSGGAAAGSSEGGRYYRTLYDHVCFEISAVTAQSDVGEAQYAEYGLRPLNEKALRRIHDEMDRMVRSFSFIGPVRGGAGWSLFTGSPCGEKFEVPQNTSVERISPSSPNFFNSLGLSCLDRFTYDSRQYAVAAKEGLSSPDAMNAWLDSSGFPRLDEMQWIADSPSATKYRNAEMAYVLHRGALFLITATDPEGSPVPFDRDGVIQHLLSSFRVR